MLHRYLRPKYLILSIVMLFAIIAVACGSDTTSDTPATKAPVAVATKAPVAAATKAPVAAATKAPAPAATKKAVPAFRPTATTKASVPVPKATAAPVAPQGQAKVETLVMAMDPAAGETNIFWNGSVDHHQQFDLTNEVLVDIDPYSNMWVPELAKSWELSPDGTEWTLYLEEGVQWHDGWGEFTAADVLHSWTMNARDDSLLGYVTDWREIDLEASRIVNDYEIVMKLKNPNPDYLFYLAPSGAGLMMSKAQWDDGGDEAYEADVIGTGPYRYTGRTYGVNVTYDRLDNHWRRGGKDGLAAPSFEKVDLRWIKEAATRNAGLLADEIHMTELTRDLADAAVADHGMKIISSNFPGNQVSASFNGLWPGAPGDYTIPWAFPDYPLNDIRVREAVNRAIDRQTLIDTLYAGRVTLSPQVGFYENLPGWNQDWMTNYERDYGFDQDKARALLADYKADVGLGSDDPVVFRGILMNMFGFPESVDTMQAVDVMLREVGINMALEEWEWSNFFAAWRDHKPEALGVWLIPPSFKTVFAQLSLFYRSTNPLSMYNDPTTDEIFSRLQQAVDLDLRDNIQREMGDYLYSQYTQAPLVYLFIEWAVNPNIIDQWPFPGSDGANYGHFDRIIACTTPEPCMN